MLTAAWIYSRYISRTQTQSKEADFIRTVESMKQVSQNYLDGERGYVKNWSAYISSNHMDMEEALDFLRTINTNEKRFIHIVDMDTYEAYSAYYPKGEEKIDTYVRYKDTNIEADLPFGEIMESMFKGGDEDKFEVLGKYRLQETQAMVVGIGTRVTLRTREGDKDYLMLRIVPVDEIKKFWVFPTEHSSAEVGIITRTGDYVIQSSSMKSQNFIEYIRGYNFQEDYNERDALLHTLKTNDVGILQYKNFRGKDCIWYYSSFGDNSSLDILGVLSKDELKASVDAWYIVLLVCGTLVLLMVIDGAYLINMNRRLREEARLSEQASRAKTQFLSAMSHDIRTPLNAVLGLMTIAKNKSTDSQRVEECMDKGLQSGKHLLTLINDVLDISKIESGSFALNPERISLKVMIQDLVEMQERNLSDRGIQLLTDFEALPHNYVYADKIRLNQIYVNLLTNAVKYTEPGGIIFLCLYQQEIPEHPENTRLVFYIEDNGIGMTEEFQKNMYHTFSREINTQVNSIQGTGLGLAIVKQMVDLMGGTIVCNSASGEGTAFEVAIDLPIVEDEEMTDNSGEEFQRIEDMHLLVAEDNDLNWEIFHELVSEQEIVCDRAENGKECVEMLKEVSPDTYSAILMDVHMPIMNGYEATRQIRSLEDDRLNKIPIIAMTADAFAEDVQACKDSGMNGHIAKPINLKILFSTLKKIKNGQL